MIRLQTLKVCGSRSILGSGLEMVLREMNTLKCLEHEHLCETLLDILKEARKQYKRKIPAKYIANLQTITVNNGKESDTLSGIPSLLEPIPLLCQNLNTLKITGKLSNMALESLYQLNKLETLELCNTWWSAKPSFYEASSWNCNKFNPQGSNGILALLEGCGRTLKRLSLSGMDVNFYDLGKVCPNMEDLSVACCFYHGMAIDVYANHPRSKPLKKLLKLELRASHNCPMMSGALSHVIRTAKNLTTLKIRSSADLDNYLRLLEDSPLPNLEGASFVFCDKVTYSGIVSVVTSQNKLKFLEIQDCLLLFLNSMHNIRELAKISKPDLKIEWTPSFITM